MGWWWWWTLSRPCDVTRRILPAPTHPYATGWSRETVNCKYTLTDLKDTKYGKSQSFLESLHCLVLIFGCLKWVRWQKYDFSKLCQNGIIALPWFHPRRTDPSDTPYSTTKHLEHLMTSLNTPKATLDVTFTFPRVHQTPKDTCRQHQTFSDTLRHSHRPPKHILTHLYTLWHL